MVWGFCPLIWRISYFLVRHGIYGSAYVSAELITSPSLWCKNTNLKFMFKYI